MILRYAVIIGLVVALLAPAASAQVRLEGLDRVYFTRVAAAGKKLPADLSVAVLLPGTMKNPGYMPGSTDSEDSFSELTVHDFEINAPSSKRRLWIREIVDNSHPRIATLWWALYAGGKRSDVWYFSSYSKNTGSKLLSNYRLDSIAMPTKDVAVFQVQGDMFRPGGAWSVTGKEWTFTVSESSIKLKRVCNVFGFFYGYDKGQGYPPISVSTEKETADGYEIREVDAVPENVLRDCHFKDPLLDNEWEFTWDKQLEIAQCIIGKTNAILKVRNFNEASFIERSR